MYVHVCVSRHTYISVTKKNKKQHQYNHLKFKYSSRDNKQEACTNMNSPGSKSQYAGGLQCVEIQYMTHLMCVLTIYYSQNVKLESNVNKPFKTPLRTKVR